MGFNLRPNPNYGEHEAIAEELDEIFDEEFPGVYWRKTDSRGKKWAKIARAYMSRDDVNPKTRFNQSAMDVAREMDRICGTAVRSTLTRGTFGDGTSISVPRTVIRLVEQRIAERDDVTVEEVVLFSEQQGE